MTKERVLNDIWNPQNEDLELQTCITLSPDLRLIEKAMDEYAKQQSISFAKWIEEGDNWSFDMPRDLVTAEMLYNEFLNRTSI